MKRLQSNLACKVLSLLLCCLCVGAFAACVHRVNVEATTYYQNAWYGSEELMANQSLAAYEMWVLGQCDELTYRGQEYYNELAEELRAENSNFRYQVVSVDGAVQESNLEGATLESLVTTVYTCDYTLDSCAFTYLNEGEETASGAAAAESGYYYRGILLGATDAAEDEIAIVTYGRLTTLVADDSYADLQEEMEDAQEYVKRMLPLMVPCGVLALVFGLWFLYSCGHKKNVEGIHLCALHRLPYEVIFFVDVCLCQGAFIAMMVLYTLYWDIRVITNSTQARGLLIGVLAALLTLLASPIVTAFVTQIKARVLLKQSLIRRICRWAWRRTRDILLFWKASLAAAAFLLVYAAVCYANGSFLVVLLLLAAAVAAQSHWLSGWERVRAGAQRIADGDLNYQIDTRGMPWDLVKEAATLNAISEGMEKAVNERMKSDRFRTELITNVSHDLKTPLTSIINYVDLLKKLEITEQPAAEYIDVLDRKSQRLKALTEDLVEASKAATGVLPVALEELDANQMVQQCLGEYEERLAAARLTLKAALLPAKVTICADGRHLWRVLDNLLGNCCKYAMPGTRVYLDMEDTGSHVVISLKNISAEPLNVPAEELMERFVQGDESRMAEGSGLGLSIAQSLCVLMGAAFQVSTDGDLFKAVVTFPKSRNR